jgi:hypothetical protein
MDEDEDIIFLHFFKINFNIISPIYIQFSQVIPFNWVFRVEFDRVMYFSRLQSVLHEPPILFPSDLILKEQVVFKLYTRI